MLEQVAHLQVVDPVGVKIEVGHGFDDREKAVAVVEFLDLLGELEPLEDVPRGRGKSVDVRHEVRRNVLGIAEQPGERVGARVVEGMFPVRVGGLAEQSVHRCFGHLLRLKFISPLQNGILGGLQDAVEASQDDYGKHDQTILWRPVRPSEPVGDFPNFGFQLFVRLDVHESSTGARSSEHSAQRVRIWEIIRVMLARRSEGSAR